MDGIALYGSGSDDGHETPPDDTVLAKRRRRKRKRDVPPAPQDTVGSLEPGPAPATRVRHQAHQVGMWSGIVYLEVPQLAFPVEEGWTPIAHPHVSLSRQLYMNKGDIVQVAEALGAGFTPFPPFDASFTHADVFVNEEGTTEFAVVTSRSEHILALIDAADTALHSLGFRRYFKDPTPHITIATRPNTCKHTTPRPLSKPAEFSFASVCFKAGDQVHRFDL